MFNGSGESFADYYLKLSSGKYTAINTVTDWVQVPGTARATATTRVGGLRRRLGLHQRLPRLLVREAGGRRQDRRRHRRLPVAVRRVGPLRLRHRRQLQRGRTATSTTSRPCTPVAARRRAAQGDDAIWSHRWYVNSTDYGTTGPTVNGSPNLYGGAQIGGSEHLVGDYTVEPEDGGLGVFTHEFGHDLGLPDYYDTAGGENGTAFWTLMSAGSWLGHGDGSIGTTPGSWGRRRSCSSAGWTTPRSMPDSPARTPSAVAGRRGQGSQAIKVNLPDETLTAKLPTRQQSGSRRLVVGSGDDLNNTLTRRSPAGRRVTPVGRPLVRHRGDYDYLYAEYSTDGGASWTQIGEPVTGSARRGRPSAGPLRTDGSAPISSTSVRHRRRRQRGRRLPRQHLRTKVGADGRCPRTSGSGDNGWTAKGWKARPAPRSTTASAYYLSGEPVSTSGTTRPCGGAVPVQLARTPRRTRWSTSRSRTACSSGTSTTATPTTTSRRTPASATRCRSTPVRTP